MPSTTVNFADVDSFEPLPEGSYDIEVDKVEVRRNKADDGDYLNWELVVIDGEYENRRLWMITSLKPQALFRLKQVLLDLGIIDEDEEEMDLEWDDDVEPTTSGGPLLLYPELQGIEAVAQVKNEMYDGRERNRVENLFGPDKKPKKKKTTRTAAAESRGNGGRSRRRVVEEEDEDEEDEEEERPRRKTSTGAKSRTQSRSREKARRRVR
ncbi:MAG TPA: DUF669 domain-containing protein [Scandinavium sp.]|uniref:DUF669 domain-containing protein n=1 Tax=Scandinavium sp. TaxID=2830653 RepID=UPI002E34FAA5|nr:DUF669 domain-containing protein [Scandinavium sp.]HEX4503378.1 DUF669 domain-containing protein [Scandinavium sp.]